MEAGPELCQQLHVCASACVRACVCVCVCVCVLVFVPVPGVGRLRSSGLHHSQMCSSVRSASVPHSLSLVPLQAPLPQALQILSAVPGHWSWKPFNGPVPLSVSWTY